MFNNSERLFYFSIGSIIVSTLLILGLKNIYLLLLLGPLTAMLILTGVAFFYYEIYDQESYEGDFVSTSDKLRNFAKVVLFGLAVPAVLARVLVFGLVLTYQLASVAIDFARAGMVLLSVGSVIYLLFVNFEVESDPEKRLVRSLPLLMTMPLLIEFILGLMRPLDGVFYFFAANPVGELLHILFQYLVTPVSYLLAIHYIKNDTEMDTQYNKFTSPVPS